MTFSRAVGDGKVLTAGDHQRLILGEGSTTQKRKWARDLSEGRGGGYMSR